ncbi:hypothetical protein [Terrabacter terrae]
MPLLGAIAAVGVVLLPGTSFPGVLMALASVASSFTFTWYFVGTGRPLAILLSDTLPKVLAALIAAALLYQGLPLSVYPLLMMSASVLGVPVAAILARAPLVALTRLTWRPVVEALRHQSVALRGRATSALYIALPVALVGMVSTESVAVFSAIERLQRLLLAVLQSVPTAMQNWVGSAIQGTERYKAIRKALSANGALSWISLLGFFLMGPLAIGILFSGKISVSGAMCLMAGVVIALTTSSRATGGLGLVAYGDLRAIANSATVGAALGIPTILVGASLYGVVGALGGEIIAEACVLGVQVRRLHTHMAKERDLYCISDLGPRSWLR